jgi:hypothetical protein
MNCGNRRTAMVSVVWVVELGKIDNYRRFVEGVFKKMSTISQKLFLASTGALFYSANKTGDLHCALTCLGTTLAVACIFHNWLWRFLVFGVCSFIAPQTGFLLSFAQFLAIYNIPTFALFGVRKPQPVQGAVFVTGCDSGMGFWTASHLANEGE